MSENITVDVRQFIVIHVCNACARYLRTLAHVTCERKYKLISASHLFRLFLHSNEQKHKKRSMNASILERLLCFYSQVTAYL